MLSRVKMVCCFVLNWYVVLCLIGMLSRVELVCCLVLNWYVVSC